MAYHAFNALYLNIVLYCNNKQMKVLYFNIVQPCCGKPLTIIYFGIVLSCCMIRNWLCFLFQYCFFLVFYKPWMCIFEYCIVLLWRCLHIHAVIITLNRQLFIFSMILLSQSYAQIFFFSRAGHLKFLLTWGNETALTFPQFSSCRFSCCTPACNSSLPFSLPSLPYYP